MVARAVVDPSLQMKVHQYQIVGRAAPTKKNAAPKIYRMKLFSKNAVLAKSKFWYFMRKINKAKKTGGEILDCKEVLEMKPGTVKNFAVWLRYDSRTGTHNMYKEYRDVTQNGAISQMYSEMTGRHRALHSTIQVMRVAAIPNALCKRPHIAQLVKADLKFPVVQKMPLGPKCFRKTFAPNRPTTFFK